MTSEILLQIQDLRTVIDTQGEPVRAVDGISLDVRRGETFALVGESGSGKSMTALSILRLLPEAGRIAGGSVRLDGLDLLALPEAAMRDVRGKRIAMIFQEPATSLNPVLTIGHQIEEVLERHTNMHGDAAGRRAVELLDAVGVPDAGRRVREYPFQLSGGLKQRAMIAMALAADPDLLIADEPTTALDVTIQSQVLELLKKLQHERGMSILLITHDLGIVSGMAHRVAVMFKGTIVEAADRNAFFAAPKHPYTIKLFDSLPEALPAAVSRQVTHAQPAALLAVRDLKVHFPIRKGLFRRTVGHVKAVDGVSLDVAAGRTLALVGESGCGKTTVGKTILQLLRGQGAEISGEALFEGADLMKLQGEALRTRRREFQIVFQDPYSSLNPRMRVADILMEGMSTLGIGGTPEARNRRVNELLSQVDLPVESRTRYPHEFSGGQRQRIAIARALAVEPRLIICDEPTSALDVSVQAQILDLLAKLQKDLGLSYLFITHNLAVVEYLAHEVAVMYLGRIVERGTTEEVIGAPKHPYTRALLSAVPRIEKGADPSLARPVIRLEGELPSPVNPPSGCHFHPRCPSCMPEVCPRTYPGVSTLSATHKTHCWLYPPDDSKKV
jgi:peptide/nickel transport system ATP-binding protein